MQLTRLREHGSAEKCNPLYGQPSPSRDKVFCSLHTIGCSFQGLLFLQLIIGLLDSSRCVPLSNGSS